LRPTYILTVAGFGGEEDYEKRFVLLANDTDKILRGGGATDRVIETLKGPEATKATVMLPSPKSPRTPRPRTF